MSIKKLLEEAVRLLPEHHAQTDKILGQGEKIYNKNGRTSLAKTTFDTFCNEYKAMLNTDYSKTFNEVINCQL